MGDRARFPVNVSLLVWSFRAGPCDEALLAEYCRTIDLCERVSVWLLRRLPVVGQLEAEFLDEFWPRSVPRSPSEGAAGGRIMMGLVAALSGLNRAALNETEYQGGFEDPDVYWNDRASCLLEPRNFDPRDDYLGFCGAFLGVLKDIRAFVFETGIFETPWGFNAVRSGNAHKYADAFRAVLRWCHFLFDECEALAQTTDAPVCEIANAIKAAAQRCVGKTQESCETSAPGQKQETG